MNLWRSFKVWGEAPTLKRVCRSLHDLRGDALGPQGSTEQLLVSNEVYEITERALKRFPHRHWRW